MARRKKEQQIADLRAKQVREQMHLDARECIAEMKGALHKRDYERVGELARHVADLAAKLDDGIQGIANGGAQLALDEGAS